jgi:hypothetical protein
MKGGFNILDQLNELNNEPDISPVNINKNNHDEEKS